MPGLPYLGLVLWSPMSLSVISLTAHLLWLVPCFVPVSHLTVLVTVADSSLWIRGRRPHIQNKGLDVSSIQHLLQEVWYHVQTSGYSPSLVLVSLIPN